MLYLTRLLVSHGAGGRFDPQRARHREMARRCVLDGDALREGGGGQPGTVTGTFEYPATFAMCTRRRPPSSTS